jgi:hypothetical protein
LTGALNLNRCTYRIDRIRLTSGATDQTELGPRSPRIYLCHTAVANILYRRLKQKLSDALRTKMVLEREINAIAPPTTVMPEP